MLKTKKTSYYHSNDTHLTECHDNRHLYAEKNLEYLPNNINITNNRLYDETFEAYKSSIDTTPKKSKEIESNKSSLRNKNCSKKRVSYNEDNFSTEAILSKVKRAKFQNRTQSIDSAKFKTNNESLDKLLKIIRHSVKLIDKNYLKLKSSQIANDEWKLVASRIDFLLFIIATIVVFTTPFVLFGKFLFTVDGPLSSQSLMKNNCKI